MRLIEAFKRVWATERAVRELERDVECERNAAVEISEELFRCRAERDLARKAVTALTNALRDAEARIGQLEQIDAGRKTHGPAYDSYEYQRERAEMLRELSLHQYETIADMEQRLQDARVQIAHYREVAEHRQAVA